MLKKRKKRPTIGVLLDWLVGWEDIPYYQTMILSGIADFAEKNDCNMLCFITGRLDSPYEWERSRNILFSFVDPANIDGLIIMASAIGFSAGKKNTQKLLKKFNNIPFVTIGEGFNGHSYVGIDNSIGMRHLVNHMIEVHNCRKIAFIKGSEGNSEADIRFEVYREALKKHSIKYNHDLVVQGDFLYQSGNDAIETLVDVRKVDFDSIIAANDNMALGALNAILEKGLFKDRNIPVVGFDDSEMSRFFSLTTVRQSFYDEGAAAAEMVLNLIHGETVPHKLELPTEFLIRDSCGCLSESILSASVKGKKSVSNGDWEAIICQVQDLSRNFVNQDERILQNQKDSIQEWFCSLLLSLINSIKNEQENDFIHFWNHFIYCALSSKTNLFVLQDMLSVFRRVIFQMDFGQLKKFKIEDLFHQARIMIGEVIQRTESSFKLMSYYQSENLDSVGEELLTELNLEYQMNLLYKRLPEFGLKSCYLSLYVDPSRPMKSSRLILAFTENGRLNCKGKEIFFPTKQIVPKCAKIFKERRSFIVQALHQGDNQLGFVLFDYGSRIGKIYEIMRFKMSAALKATLLFENLKKQAQSLELEVLDRTADLSRINAQLEIEIAERKKAESELIKAFKELEHYNKKLHNQSMRDELTGLYNRRGFLTLASQQFEITKKRNKSFLLFFADLDRLKTINDSYGHKEGDKAIVQVAEILKKTFREMDIVARLGGDEFTVLTVDSGPSRIEEIKSRIVESFNHYNRNKKKPYVLSISLGVASYDPSRKITFEELITEADKELYKQKQIKKSNNYQ